MLWHTSEQTVHPSIHFFVSTTRPYRVPEASAAEWPPVEASLVFSATALIAETTPNPTREPTPAFFKNSLLLS